MLKLLEITWLRHRAQSEMTTIMCIIMQSVSVKWDSLHNGGGE